MLTMAGEDLGEVNMCGSDTIFDLRIVLMELLREGSFDIISNEKPYLNFRVHSQTLDRKLCSLRLPCGSSITVLTRSGRQSNDRDDTSEPETSSEDAYLDMPELVDVPEPVATTEVRRAYEKWILWNLHAVGRDLERGPWLFTYARDKFAKAPFHAFYCEHVFRRQHTGGRLHVMDPRCSASSRLLRDADVGHAPSPRYQNCTERLKGPSLTKHSMLPRSVKPKKQSFRLNNQRRKKS